MRGLGLVPRMKKKGGSAAKKGVRGRPFNLSIKGGAERNSLSMRGRNEVQLTVKEKYFLCGGKPTSRGGVSEKESRRKPRKKVKMAEKKNSNVPHRKGKVVLGGPCLMKRKGRALVTYRKRWPFEGERVAKNSSLEGGD